MEDKKFKDYCKSAVPAFFSLVCLIVLFAIMFLFGSCDNKYKRENERLREELERVQQYVPLQRDTIHDSVEIITQKVIEVEKIKEVLTDEDRKLLKDAGIAAKELMSLQKTGMETKDSVNLSAKDSTKEGSPLYYKDAWAEFEFHDRTLKYSVKDSLAIAVKKEYKRRFLWWRWGVKGYELKVINFNPHSTVRYNTFIKRKE